MRCREPCRDPAGADGVREECGDRRAARGARHSGPARRPAGAGRPPRLGEEGGRGPVAREGLGPRPRKGRGEIRTGWRLGRGLTGDRLGWRSARAEVGADGCRGGPAWTRTGGGSESDGDGA